ncbi:hypothetical protein [Nonomuraea sp. NPDC050202]|uniref:hypothetical protein n=1 Tax=Nonomuraea sp. NPDC050202 TaxID=3155035 RepID=UPI0033C7809F
MADLDMVEMTHPDVEGTVSVPRSAFEHHHVRAGWRLADPPDRREEVRQVLLAAGVERAEADRVVAAAYPPEDPPTDEKSSDGAPADAGASSSPDTDDQPPRRRRASSKEEGE